MMRAQSDPRRVYNRNDITHTLFAGVTFGPGRRTSKVDPKKEVRVTALGNRGGRRTVSVTQGRGITETWSETKVPVKHRS